MYDRIALGLMLVALGSACSSDNVSRDDDARPRDEGEEDTDESGGAREDASVRMDATVRRDAASRAPDADVEPDDGSTSEPRRDASLDAQLPQRNYDWKPGDYPSDLRAQTYLELKDLPGQGGRTRGYKVHVPAKYDASKPAPVLYAFHGWQQNAVMFGIDGSDFIALSDEHGFILVMPNGIQGEDGFGGSWNAGVCCGAAAAQKLDDVGFVRAVHEQLLEHVNVDASRVYATGLSNGGFFTHRLGCEAADLFAAVAPGAASIGTAELGSVGTNPDPDFKECKPSRPIPVLATHGTSDPIVPYAGMKPSLDRWAKLDGCSATTEPAKQPASGGDTTCVTYTGCPSGIEVTGCSVQGGGHCWFGNESCGTGAPGIGNIFVGADSTFLNASQATWEFVSRFHL